MPCVCEILFSKSSLLYSLDAMLHMTSCFRVFWSPRSHPSMRAHGFKLLFAACSIFCLQRVLYILFGGCSIFYLQCVLYFVCRVFYILFAVCFNCILFAVCFIFCLQLFECLQQVLFSLLQIALVCDIYFIDSGVPFWATIVQQFLALPFYLPL